MKFQMIVALTAICLSIDSSAQTIAMIQYDADSHYGDYETNIQNLEILAREAVNAGAAVLLLPEGSAWGYTAPGRTWCRPGLSHFQGKTCDDVSLAAEKVPGGRTGLYWQDFAAAHNVTVLYHVMEQDEGAFYNTLAAVNARGLIGKYRKRYLYYIDEAYAQPGSDLFVLEIEGRAYGVMICMDANYGTLFSAYKQRGVTDFFISMDWDQSPLSSRAGQVFFRNQARRWQVNIFASDQAAWDSTGFYPATGEARLRAPLPEVGVGTNGLTLHQDF